MLNPPFDLTQCSYVLRALYEAPETVRDWEAIPCKSFFVSSFLTSCLPDEEIYPLRPQGERPANLDISMAKCIVHMYEKTDCETFKFYCSLKNPRAWMGPEEAVKVIDDYLGHEHWVAPLLAYYAIVAPKMNPEFRVAFFDYYFGVRAIYEVESKYRPIYLAVWSAYQYWDSASSH